MRTRITYRINATLERFLPEQRLFLRSDSATRFIRLRPGTQAIALFGSSLIVGWSIIATAVLLMDSIGAGNVRERADRERALYEQRLNDISVARDARASEARAAQDRFTAAMAQISQMQSELLASEDRRKELETGIGVIQTTLQRTMQERDTALEQGERLADSLEAETGSTRTSEGKLGDATSTVDFLTQALELTAAERDEMELEAARMKEEADAVAFERELLLDKNDRIFSQLEEAVSVSIAPLDKMFRDAGLPPKQLLDTVRRGYSGQGGPLTPISFSTKGMEPDADSLRANKILEGLDEMNLYRIAATKAPFDIPIKDSFRYTSGYGPRWGRMHEGTDFAGAHGTPIYSTGDGVVIHAGRMSGYGNLVKIQHEFGIETRYAHMSKIRVKVGQRVSRGDRIGDMGNTGRSTGTHLHYEVRVNGNPVNPMSYIKAAKNVF
ncbi:M23 family metallopeptidase [Pacificitalea manganoxidans]|uniref:M23 family metallopeptidase n=1 Tax=Pacificitalea manganoxidans TaxID=1411902 RepID=UPI0018E06557|nr:M23 family metallopeptidase [Pacificitalea manganoxidans]MDR6307820.1 murein DD-endopeptidase MepM/ murein hydrolase activator NlpD [Pacificitalea manganoxidans]